MPRVPVYEQQQVQPTRTAVPNLPNAPQQSYTRVRVDPDAFGAGIGQAVSQLGGQLGHVQAQAIGLASEAKQKADSARVMDAYSKIGQWQNEHIYNPKTGVRAKRRGESAVGVADEYGAEFEKFAQELSTGLATDQQREAFARIYARERDTTFRELARYEGTQFEELAKAKFDAAVGTSISNGANKWEDRKATLEALKLGETAILERADLEKTPGEVTQTSLRKFRTAFHLEVLDRMTDAGDAEAAEKWLEEHKGDIDGAALGNSNLEKVISAGKEQAVLAKTITNITRETDSYEEQLQLAGTIEDVKLQDKVRDFLRQRHQTEKTAQEEVEKERKGRVFQQVESSGGWLDQNSKDFALLSEDGKADAMARARNIRAQNRQLNAEERRIQREEDDLAVQQFSALPDKDQLSADLKQRFPGVSPSGLARLEGIKKGATETWKKGLTPAKDDVTAAAGAAASSLWAGKGENDTKRRNAFKAKVLEWWLNRVADPNAERPSRKEVNDFIADELLKGEVKGTIFNPDKRKGEVAPGEEFIPFGPKEQDYAPNKSRGAEPAAAPSTKVNVVGPDGQRGRADPAGLDEWLRTHPGWRRE